MTNKPVYMSVADSLIGDIASGKYPVGDALPTERELCESFQISRHTARESLRQLELRGLINRRQGSGSTVVSRTAQVRYEQNIQSIDDLLEQGNQSRLDVLNTEKVPPEADSFAGEIARQTGNACIKIKAIRYARNDSRPLALVDIHVAVQNNAQAKRLLNLGSAAREIVTLMDVSQIGRIEQSLNAVTLRKDEAQALQVELSDAALRTLRYYFQPQGELMVVANSLYRGDLYTYMSTLHRG